MNWKVKDFCLMDYDTFMQNWDIIKRDIPKDMPFFVPHGDKVEGFEYDKEADTLNPVDDEYAAGIVAFSVEIDEPLYSVLEITARLGTIVLLPTCRQGTTFGYVKIYSIIMSDMMEYDKLELTNAKTVKHCLSVILNGDEE